MEKLHSIISVAFAVVFLIILQQFPLEAPVFRIMIAAIGGLLLVISAYNRWYLQKKGKYEFWMWLRPTLFYGVAFTVFSIIPVYFFKGAFLLITVGLGTVFEMFLGNYSENVVLNESLVIAFGAFMSLVGYNFYFPAFHNLFLLAVFFSSLIIIRSFLQPVPSSARFKLATAVTLSLFMVELFWALSYLPFHYTIHGLLLFIFFYFSLTLTFYALFHTLSIKKVQFHLALLLLCTAVVLLFTPWRVIQ